MAPTIAPFPSATPLHTNNILRCRTVAEQSIAALLIFLFPTPTTECEVDVFSKDYTWILIISNRMLYTPSHCTSTRNTSILSPIDFQCFQVGSSCYFADYYSTRLHEDTRACYMSFLLALFCLITPELTVLDYEPTNKTYQCMEVCISTSEQDGGACPAICLGQ